MQNIITIGETQLDASRDPSLLHKISLMLAGSEDDSDDPIPFPDVDKETGKPLSTIANIAFFLRRFDIEVRYDDFSLRTYVFGIPGHTLLDDAAFNDICFALDFLYLRAPRQWLWATLDAYSRLQRQHPLRTKLEHLQNEWDGTPRLDTWLIDYCGVEDTPYAQAVGAKWLIAAVRRVRQPGCKFDHVLIFEGPQGIGKSTIFRVLAYEDWFTDNLTIGAEPQQVIELTRGKWICELAELTNIGKREVENVKAFITRQTDEARKAYGRETQQAHRQFVLAATTNRKQYLRDETGDRRFWMVETKGVIDTGQADLPLMLDAPGLQAIRDQLWAEAAAREAKGESIHLSPEIEAIARAQQMKRFDADDRQQLLEDLLEGKSGFAPNDEIYRAIGIEEIKDRHPGISKLVKSAMVRLGWEGGAKLRVGRPSRQLRGWQSPDGCKDVLMYAASKGFVAIPRESYPPRDQLALVALEDQCLTEDSNTTGVGAFPETKSERRDA